MKRPNMIWFVIISLKIPKELIINSLIKQGILYATFSTQIGNLYT